MSIEKIPTAEEFARSLTSSGGGRNIYSIQEVAMVAIELSKLHVQAALKAASENARMDCHDLTSNGEVCQTSDHRLGIDEYHGHEGYNEDPIRIVIQKESILNAYPLGNIK